MAVSTSNPMVVPNPQSIGEGSDFDPAFYEFAIHERQIYIYTQNGCFQLITHNPHAAVQLEARDQKPEAAVPFSPQSFGDQLSTFSFS